MRLYKGALLVLALTLLTGCLGGGGDRQTLLSGGSWPGMTVHNEILYVANRGQVHAVDDQGRQLWSFPESPSNNQNFFAAPAVEEGLLVITDYSNAIFALDPERGTELWSFMTNNARFIGGATIGEDYVFAAAVNGVLYAIDKASGEEVWRFSADRSIWSTPVLDNGTLYITSLDRHVYAVDAEDGSELWRFPDVDVPSADRIAAIVNTPTLHNGVLYFGSLNTLMYALDVETQEVLWEYPTDNWIFSSPIIAEEANLVIGADLDGTVFALNLTTGEEVWTFPTDGPVVGQPLLVDALASEEENGDTVEGSVIYIASEDTRLYQLEVSSGDLVTQPTTIENVYELRFLFFQTGEEVRPMPVYTSPVLFAGNIVVGSHQQQGSNLLVAYDRESMLEDWAFEPR